MIEVLKSKIHRVTVTQSNLNYVGSITIDEDLLDAANIIAGEKVHIVDNNNGERFETYVIKGERGSGCIFRMYMSEWGCSTQGTGRRYCDNNLIRSYGF